MGLYFRHPASMLHDTGPHPENAGRIRAIEAVLEAAGWPGLELAEPPLAEREWLTRVHDPALVDSIEDLCAAGGGAIDLDTIAVAASWEAALRAAGAAAEGARTLLAGEQRLRRSAGCGHPAITPSRTGRWASACSTTPRSAPPTRSPSAARSGS